MDNLTDYTEEFLERDLVVTLIRNGNTVRVYNEYLVKAEGKQFKKGEETIKIEEKRERFFQRRYEEEIRGDLSNFVPKVWDKR